MAASRWDDRMGCVILLVALGLGIGFTLLDLPPVPAVVAFQRRFMDTDRFLNTVLVVTAIIVVVMVPIFLLVERIVQERQRS